MGTWQDCDEHEDNHFVGGCISCTYAEYRRYQALYHEAATTVVSMQEYRLGRDALDSRIDGQVARYAKELTQ